MVANLTIRRLKPLTAAIGFGAGAIVALAFAVLPQWRLEALVETLGLPALLSAARPPLGATARSVLALGAGGIAGAGVYLALRFGFGFGRAAAIVEPDFAVPILRRADAHPDAPARRPIRASEDLGAPLPIGQAVPAPLANPERISVHAVPADLETPLAAFDPGAIPETPREAIRLVAPLMHRPRIVDPGERFETFALTPIRREVPPVADPVVIAEPIAVRAAPAAVAAVAPAIVQAPSSVASLLERLERSTARRQTRAQPSIEETLGMLRGLAAQ